MKECVRESLAQQDIHLTQETQAGMHSVISVTCLVDDCTVDAKLGGSNPFFRFV